MIPMRTEQEKGSGSFFRPGHDSSEDRVTLKEKLSWTFSSDSSLSRAEGGGSLQARRTEFTRMSATHVFLASTLSLAAATCSLRCGAAEPAGDTIVFVGELISIEGKPDPC